MPKKQKQNRVFDKKFGTYLRRKRLSKNWTQEELASMVGNNAQNISRMERGEITPTLFWCTKLADAFDTSLISFLRNFKYSESDT